MNALAAGIVAGGKARDLKQGVELATKSIDSGAALAKLIALVEHSQKIAQAATA